jgi:hypothetical protein
MAWYMEMAVRLVGDARQVAEHAVVGVFPGVLAGLALELVQVELGLPGLHQGVIVFAQGQVIEGQELVEQHYLMRLAAIGADVVIGDQGQRLIADGFREQFVVDGHGLGQFRDAGIVLAGVMLQDAQVHMVEQPVRGAVEILVLPHLGDGLEVIVVLRGGGDFFEPQQALVRATREQHGRAQERGKECSVGGADGHLWTFGCGLASGSVFRLLGRGRPRGPDGTRRIRAQVRTWSRCVRRIS